ncbi:putative holin-like toxin [Butyricicoccus faecihominis]
MLYSECQQRCETGCSSQHKGGDDMVTYSDLFQFGLLIVAIISLCLKHRR